MAKYEAIESDYILEHCISIRDIKSYGLIEEFTDCETEQEREDFLHEVIDAALNVYGQANRWGLLSEDYYSLDESKLPTEWKRQLDRN